MKTQNQTEKDIPSQENNRNEAPVTITYILKNLDINGFCKSTSPSEKTINNEIQN